jgi:hypothetical protein
LAKSGSTELGDSEVIIPVFKQFECDFTVWKVLEKVIRLSEMGLCWVEAMALLASRGSAISSTSPESISDSILQSILAHSNLNIASEDSLSEFSAHDSLRMSIHWVSFSLWSANTCQCPYDHVLWPKSGIRRSIGSIHLFWHLLSVPWCNFLHILQLAHERSTKIHVPCLWWN